MKKILTFAIVLIALAACAAPPVQSSEPAATALPLVNMPNPASVYCTENGNKLEIRMAADGSQSGVCVFLDGSACDEWAYFRGECGPAVPASPTPAPTVAATATAGTETSQVSTPIGADDAGSYMPPEATEALADWWGVIKSTQPGAQFDDYFERQGLGQIIRFGIDSADPAVKSQIEMLRDSDKTVHLYGALVSNVPDYNGSQIQVDRIEVE
jgi:putative hemolysin